MTTLYRPVLIESAEQAEALPVGTVAIQSWGHGTTARTLTNGRWITPSGAALPHVETVGFTALVPIEAEEETRDHPGIMLPTNPPRYPKQTRLVTDWTITGGPSPDRRGDCT